jgi:hypothetical protein
VKVNSILCLFLLGTSIGGKSDDTRSAAVRKASPDSQISHVPKYWRNWTDKTGRPLTEIIGPGVGLRETLSKVSSERYKVIGIKFVNAVFALVNVYSLMSMLIAPH